MAWERATLHSYAATLAYCSCSTFAGGAGEGSGGWAACVGVSNVCVCVRARMTVIVCDAHGQNFRVVHKHVTYGVEAGAAGGLLSTA